MCKNKSKVKVILCTGKFFYDLDEYKENKIEDVSIVRVEQLSPFP